MAQNKLLVLVLLLLVCFLEIQCIVGRHLMLEQNHNSQKVQTHDRILAKETGTILDRKVNVHGVTINKAAVVNPQSPPSPPSVVVGARATHALPTKDVDNFWPTDSGPSDGAGHSIQN